MIEITDDADLLGKVPESTFDRQPIVQYSPGSAASQDYRKWVAEYIGREG